VALVSVPAVGASLACGGLLGLEEPTVLDGGNDGAATGDGSSGSEGGPPGEGGGNAPDSSRGDAGSDVLAGDALGCAPVPNNLLANNNADFELGCTAWSVVDGGAGGGTLGASTQAHCGSMACEACPDVNAIDVVQTDISIPIFAGEQYDLRASVRVVGTPDQLAVLCALNLAGGGAVLDGPVAFVSGGYSPYLATFKIPADSTLTGVQVLLQSPTDGGCVLLDDMVLVRTGDAGSAGDAGAD
jgi:hypothetical protein